MVDGKARKDFNQARANAMAERKHARFPDRGRAACAGWRITEILITMAAPRTPRRSARHPDYGRLAAGNVHPRV
jgi:hypothetical protein